MPFDDTTRWFTETAETDTLLILRAMRHRLRNPAGWCKDQMETRGGRVCLVGALHRAQDAHYSDGPLPDGASYRTINHRILDADCRVTGRTRYMTMENFNDARATKHRDIIAALDRAIEDEQLGLQPKP